MTSRRRGSAGVPITAATSRLPHKGRRGSAIVRGKDRISLQEACALAAAPSPDVSDPQSHSGYALNELVVRCWAVGVPVRGDDHSKKVLGEGDYGFLQTHAEWRVHRFGHKEPRGQMVQCVGGHAGRGSVCMSKSVSVGDGEPRWRYDGARGIPDKGVISCARQRLDSVRRDLLNAGHDEADISVTPSIVQIAEQLEKLPNDWPERGSGSSVSRPIATSERETAEVEQAIRRGTDPARRRAVEEHAMDVAMSCYRDAGWKVDDVSATESFDLLCTRDGEELHVEVKAARQTPPRSYSRTTRSSTPASTELRSSSCATSRCPATRAALSFHRAGIVWSSRTPGSRMTTT